MDKLIKVRNHFDQFEGRLAHFSYRHEFTMNAVRLKIVMRELENYSKGKLLDLGCGEGYTTCEFLKSGWDAYGLELSNCLIKGAKKRLIDIGHSQERITEGSATDLSVYDNGSFDVVTCLGVAYYIKDQDKLYKEVHRVLKPGGVFICSHQNELFSLFTFNKYTIEFFKKYVFKGDANQLDLLSKFQTLISNPEEPKKYQNGSARGELELYPANPLTITQELEKFGMNVSVPIIYHGWHKIPPLMMSDNDRFDSEKEDINHTHDWRGTFMSAHFLVISTKT